MAAQLELLGYRADYVDNGVQALEYWQQGGYNLLLTDIRMPEMNGYELVTEIRKLERNADQRAPIIAITANALKADVEKCFDVGVDGVISKPVELDELRSVLEKWVSTSETPLDTLDAQQGIVPTVKDAVDLNVLVQSTGDKPELHQDLLKSYRDELDDQLSNIQQAFAWKNNEQIAEYTHKLKSSSRSLGAMALAMICQRLESKASEAAWDDIGKPHTFVGEACCRSV